MKHLKSFRIFENQETETNMLKGVLKDMSNISSIFPNRYKDFPNLPDSELSQPDLDFSKTPQFEEIIEKLKKFADGTESPGVPEDEDDKESILFSGKKIGKIAIDDRTVPSYIDYYFKKPDGTFELPQYMKLSKFLGVCYPEMDIKLKHSFVKIFEEAYNIYMEKNRKS